MTPLSNELSLATNLVGQAFDFEVGNAGLLSECLVILTDELADHIIQMYYNTNWDAPGNKEIDLPDDIFSGEMDEEALKSYVGKHILLARYGEPWEGVLDEPAFLPGAYIDFPDSRLIYSAQVLQDMFDSITLYSLFNDLVTAIKGLSDDGMSENEIRSMFENEYCGGRVIGGFSRYSTSR